ncbi:iron chelate uptake ABC transporter family permease subunit [Rubrobacter tropicus]|uniref:Iron chelate uptake ABC transporter family permease subunit n=2 Tax=Rubrobacter tropicus TaxID=2653851 RepID=A0A6G8QFC1_9ACTN|nr:iron chelate uptake ABC transporter family permease subunit [Rubrobacter tropicus]
MRTGLLAAVLVGVTCAVLGVYVVLRSMAFIGDALAHTVLPGLVSAYLLGLNLLGGAVVAGVATALGIGWLSRRGTVREDTAIGITFTGMFALGVLLMSTADSFRDFSHMLFGNILGITPSDVALISVLALAVLAAIYLFHKELELTSFDPVHARAIGLSADTVRYGLLVLLSLTVVAGIQAVGVVLISALLITPAAAASLLTKSLPRMMAISASIAVVSSVTGLYASYYLDVASGAAIVLACTACFVVASAIRALRQIPGNKEALPPG